ncbi:MAG: hypothetical protein HY342_02955 [Candidatus Lambdaproteobacteria bacterium]|nr:hypothetical protein [Candidatus Lambdaproteobacteria bacterium]
MCIIVDINIATDVLFPAPIGADEFEPIREAFGKGTAKLVCGGKLRDEYDKSAKVRRQFLVLERAGRARIISKESLDDTELRNIDRFAKCKSNDKHILALAICSGARLLCTNDGNLINDFRNKDIIEPRGNVYKYKKHKPLIARHCTRLRIR